MELSKLSRRALTVVSMAVELIDDVTGEPVRGSNARAWIEGLKPPIKKTDGWFVFTGLSKGKYVISAEGGTYTRKDIPFEFKGGTVETLRIRLHPNKLYKPPTDCIRIEGKAAPERKIYIYSEDKNTVLKILSPCEGGTDRASLFGTGAYGVEGRLLRFKGKTGNGEILRAKKLLEGENAEYELESVLKGDYPKVGTSVSIVTETRADAKGEFLALVNKHYVGEELVLQFGRRKERINLEGRKNISIELESSE